MENTQYRLATVADINTILPMAHAFHLEDGHPLVPSSEAAIRGALKGNDLGKIFLVENEGKASGYFVLCFTLSIEFGGLVVILDDFYLKPESRGRGIGKFLLEEIKKIAKEKNAVQIFLEVENANARAQNFYLRSGFKIRERGMMEYFF